MKHDKNKCVENFYHWRAVHQDQSVLSVYIYQQYQYYYYRAFSCSPGFSYVELLKIFSHGGNALEVSTLGFSITRLLILNREWETDSIHTLVCLCSV